MQCSEFAQFLEQESDGPLSNDAAGHLDTCSNCGLLWRDLSEIRTAGLDWGADDPAPPERVWIALRAQMESEGLIRDVAAQDGLSAGQFENNLLARWFFGASRPAFAGACLAVVLVAVSLVSVRAVEPVTMVFSAKVPAAPVSFKTPNDINSALDNDMQQAMASIPTDDSSVTASLRQNLGIVNNLIAVCEKSVREQPNNQMARDYLYGAYEQKAVLLATAMDHSTLEGR